MPVYEYYCESCNGIFEELRPMREASDPVPCPECFRDAKRIMPTSFAAFTFRDGYPRRIPDKGTYYHLGKEVSKPVTGGVRPNEHPEINKPKPKPKLTKGERADRKERRMLERKQKERVARETPPPRPKKPASRTFV
ncbi:MAG TPA: zinc ribbon domain-containing protein [Dehalococcoidia bacterium]|nr:zinc ribbon domain-containing protein [Dehalococcoidia bacterium]